MPDIIVDIKLTKDSYGNYDVTFTDTGDFTPEISISNAIIISLLQEKRADESEHSIPELRRGWWGNELNDVIGYEAGSKLWLLSQAKNTEDTLNRSIDYSRDCLQWLIEDGYVNDIQVSGVRTVFAILLSIKIVRINGETETLTYNLFENYIED
jgi:phage gp46-like protein